MREPPSRFRKWCRRGLFAAAALAMLLVPLDLLVIPEVMSGSIVTAPNAAAALDESWEETGLPKGGHAVSVRVPVGPPEAHLATLVFPPAEGGAVHGTILVLHGLRDGKRSQLTIGRHFSRLGYRVVLVDHRGQGRSTGKFLTYGVRESRDMVQLLDLLEQVGMAAPPVGVLGYSYGGAVALQWAACDARVKAVVSVSAFSALREVLPPYVAHFAPAVSWWIGGRHLDRALALAGERAGFDPDDADTVGAAARTAARILVIHGRRDLLVPVEQADRIHRAAGNRAELVLLEGDHFGVTRDESGEVRDRAEEWFGRWLATD